MDYTGCTLHEYADRMSLPGLVFEQGLPAVSTRCCRDRKFGYPARCRNGDAHDAHPGKTGPCLENSHPFGTQARGKGCVLLVIPDDDFPGFQQDGRPDLKPGVGGIGPFPGLPGLLQQGEVFRRQLLLGSVFGKVESDVSLFHA